MRCVRRFGSALLLIICYVGECRGVLAVVVYDVFRLRCPL